MGWSRKYLAKLKWGVTFAKMENNKLLQKQKGFTLVEIIAALVILGILAAVAIPKYFELKEEARDRAFDAALEKGVGRVNQYFANQLLKGNKPDQIVYDNTTIGTDLDDFTLDTVDDGTNITLTVKGKAGTKLAGQSMVRSVPRPGSL